MLALAAAAGCSDSFPPSPGPLDRFYYPVGMAVRRLPAGNTALLVVSSNFDLRYDFDIGGSVLSVDPDASADALAGDPTLAVLGGVNMGSFGGEVTYLAGTSPTELGGACGPLAADPVLAAGGAKVVAASRGTQRIHVMDMDARGGLACNGCDRPVPAAALDPYDVAATCAPPGSGSVAAVYVTHLRSPGNAGLLTELDLLGGTLSTLVLGDTPTFSSTFDPGSGRLYTTSRIGAIDQAPLRWFNPLTLPAGGSPLVETHNVAADVRGALTRQLAVFQDATAGTTTGYLRLELFDYDIAAANGSFVTTGGALAVYDFTPNVLGDPAMRLLRMVPTCNGAGQIRVLPPRPGLRPLLALTCDAEGTLLFYDDQMGAIAGRIALDPVSGLPRLGLAPFGLAVEPRAAGRCLRGSAYPGPCTRLYVSAFNSSWVTLVELDVAAPANAMIVKRIGRERD